MLPSKLGRCGQVTVQVDARAPVTVSINDAATRPRFYRRTRSDGTEIDDFEASLAVMEGHLARILVQVLREGRLTNEHKTGLAQFVGMQIVRSPSFRLDNTKLVATAVGELKAHDLRPAALAAAGGDVGAVLSKVQQAFDDPTHRLMRMRHSGLLMASMIAHMRWHLVEFSRPLLVYSDQPVVIWPGNAEVAEPAASPLYRPLEAAEVRVPLGPKLAVVMSWDDAPTRAVAMRGNSGIAGELNAFTAGQADRQWMHQPDIQPPFSTGYQRVLAPRLLGRPADGQLRRRAAARSHEILRDKKYLTHIRAVTDVGA